MPIAVEEPIVDPPIVEPIVEPIVVENHIAEQDPILPIQPAGRIQRTRRAPRSLSPSGDFVVIPPFRRPRLDAVIPTALPAANVRGSGRRRGRGTHR